MIEPIGTCHVKVLSELFGFSKSGDKLYGRGNLFDLFLSDNDCHCSVRMRSVELADFCT